MTTNDLIERLASELKPVSRKAVLRRIGIGLGISSVASAILMWSWLGMPAGLLSLDAGSATMGHIDSTDRNAWTYLQDVATTEGGALFVSADGLLTMHSRARTFGVATSVDLAVDAAVIDPSTRLVHSTADVVNDITVTRSGGAVARVVDSASVAEYG